MTLSKEQVRTLVLWFFVHHGKFPPDTTLDNWENRKMSEMQFDDPPLPKDPHYEKKKLATLLQFQFNSMGLSLKSPLPIMKNKGKTMRELWEFCYANMAEMKVI